MKKSEKHKVAKTFRIAAIIVLLVGLFSRVLQFLDSVIIALILGIIAEIISRSVLKEHQQKMKTTSKKAKTSSKKKVRKKK